MVKLIYFNDSVLENDYLKNYKIDKITDVVELVEKISNEDYHAIIVQSNFTEISINLFVNLVKYLSPEISIVFVEKINDELEELLYKLEIDCIIDLNKSVSLNNAIIKRFVENLKDDIDRFIFDRKYDLKIDLVTKIVKQNSQPVKLSATEYSLLEYLVVNRGRILSRKEIEQNIWGNNISEFESRVIDVYILKLRRKFGEHCIKTVRGKGYIWSE